tara:strand:+ start:339 stop:449 length:111 start_codon:yes stop_codon:yes gene_type:complete
MANRFKTPEKFSTKQWLVIAGAVVAIFGISKYFAGK